MTAKDHNKLVGIFLLVHGGIQALTMILLAVIYGGLGAFMLTNARRDEEQIAAAVVIGMIFFVVVMALIFVLPQLLAGWKLLKEKPSARTWGIIGSIVALLFFPLGTAAGIYGLWFLFGEEGKRFYLTGGNQNMYSMPPPPPNQWR